MSDQESTSKKEIKKKPNLKLYIPRQGQSTSFPERSYSTANEGRALSPRTALAPSAQGEAAVLPMVPVQHGKTSYSRSQSVPVHHSVEASSSTRVAEAPVMRRSRRSSIRQAPAVIRSGSRRVKEATQTFVGVGKNFDKDHEKWKLRHLRYCSFRYGKLKPQHENELDESFSATNSPSLPHIQDPYARVSNRYRLQTGASATEQDGAAASTSAYPVPPRTPLTPGNRSIASTRLGPGGVPIVRMHSRKRRDSVARMSLKVVNAFLKGTPVMENLVVGDQPLMPPSRPMVERHSSFRPSEAATGGASAAIASSQVDGADFDASFFAQEMPTIVEGESLQDEVFFDHNPVDADGMEPSRMTDSVPLRTDDIDGEFHQRHREQELGAAKAPVDGRGGRRIGVDRVLEHAFRGKKRVFGRGLVGGWLDRRLTRRRINSSVKRQLDSFDNHRPYFTYWICFVHILVTIISISVYGIASVGFTDHVEKFTTTKTSLSRVTETFSEPQNFWIGPRTKDLIRLGAKYSPCMRSDPKIREFLLKEREVEKKSACCVRNDNSGCIQTTSCPYTFAKFVQWPKHDAPLYISKNGTKVPRTSGSVCGQDPRYCKSQHAAGPEQQWPDDITKWPICRHPLPENVFRTSTFDNVKCNLVGRPCCIGQEARCEIVTEEYCKYKHGIYHPEATLCSQVNCMQDTCGLIKFRDPDVPDQIYRLWLPILMHAGIFHCMLSVIFQMTVLRDMEKLAGWLRISIIYMLSGITGNLGSAIFLPYRAEVGPAGSIFGILACLFVEVIQCWQLFSSPRRALSKLVSITILLFIAGTLPWIDNFAHIFGFIAGFFLSFTFLPYIHFNTFDRRRKQLQVITSFLIFLGLFTTLVFFFYISPVTDCSACKHINCIEIIENFCSNHGFQPETRHN